MTILGEPGLTAFLKTSGGKGIHIVVPLTPYASWNEEKDCSRAIVKHMANLIPSRFVAVLGPKNRVGRIFIDYLRNSKGATTVNLYAARAREGSQCRSRFGGKKYSIGREQRRGPFITFTT